MRRENLLGGPSSRLGVQLAVAGGDHLDSGVRGDRGEEAGDSVGVGGDRDAAHHGDAAAPVERVHQCRSREESGLGVVGRHDGVRATDGRAEGDDWNSRRVGLRAGVFEAFGRHRLDEDQIHTRADEFDDLSRLVRLVLLGGVHVQPGTEAVGLRVQGLDLGDEEALGDRIAESDVVDRPAMCARGRRQFEQPRARHVGTVCATDEQTLVRQRVADAHHAALRKPRQFR